MINLLKTRFKNLLIYLLIFVMLLTNLNLTTIIVNASISDEYMQDLNIGDVLLPNTTYYFSKLNGHNLDYYYPYVYFDETGIEKKSIDFISNGCEIYYGSCKISYLNDTYITSLNTIYNYDDDGNYKVYYYYLSDNKNGFFEWAFLGTNETLNICDDYDENGNYYYSITLPDDYENTYYETLENNTSINKTEISNGTGGSYVNSYATITPPESTLNNDKVVGWYVEDIYYDSASYQDVIKFIPLYENSTIKINFYEKEKSINDEYILTNIKYFNTNNSLELVNGSDLTDAVFIKWDKEIDTTQKEMDLYAEYGLKTKIIEQPKDATVNITDTAVFDISAVGENLSYEWYIGDLIGNVYNLEIINNTDFITDNNIFTSNNKNGDTTSLLEFNEFTLEETAILSYDYFISSEENYDIGYIKLIDINNDDNTIYKSYSGINLSEYKNDNISLAPGTYKIQISYKKDYSYDEGEDYFSVKNFKLNDININDYFYSIENETLFSTNKTADINKDNENFIDGKYVQCIVKGTYGTEKSSLAKLNIIKKGTEILSIKAIYNGEPIEVGLDYNKEDVSVVATIKNYETDEITTETVKDFEVDSLTVKNVGENNFTASYKNKTSDFTVIGFKEIKITGIEAKYADESVLVGDKFDTSKVEIIVHYDDDTTKTLTYDELTSKPDDTTVTKIGWNDYEVSYNEFSTILEVHGYDLDKIIATYKGEDILVNHDYDKSDVEVIAYYTEDVNKNIKKETVTNFEVDSLTVKNVGENNFTASYKNKTSDFTVTGVKNKEIIQNNTSNTVSSNNSTTINTSTKLVETGDNSNVILYVTLLSFSILGVITLLIKIKKK